jgi:peptide chain release factor 1
MMNQMKDTLAELAREFEELERRLSKPDVVQDRAEYKRLSKRHSELQAVVRKYYEYQEALKGVEEARSLLKEADEELHKLAREEMERLQAKADAAERELAVLLSPPEPSEDRNAIVEVRAGTGGEEAALFARDLFRMYTRFAERRGWKVEVLSSNDTGLGGVKEVIFAVEGKGAFGLLSYESGVHRVQRVPVTESSGRLHTSAATVAVLLEAEEVEVDIAPDELKIDTYRAAGAGGQHVQKNETAIRITHLPTGLVVTCQDERSQLQNKDRALRVLRSQLLEMKRREQELRVSETRRSQIRSGDRSEKIRTYNFPQRRVTDHRITFSVFNLEEFLAGEIDGMLDALRRADRPEFKTQS